MSRLIIASSVVLVALIVALHPEAAAAGAGNVWPIPDTRGQIFRTARRFVEGQTVSYGVRPKTPGCCVILHLQGPASGASLPRIASCYPMPGPSVVTYTVPPGGTGWYYFVAHALRTETPGVADIFVNGVIAGRDVPIGGHSIELLDSGVAWAIVSTVLTPGGTEDTALVLRNSDGSIGGFDDDSGVGRASTVLLSVTHSRQKVVVGTASGAFAPGPTRLVVNDLLVTGDRDRDSVGDDLETVLRMCPGRTPSPAGWDCTAIGDPRDTDEDGILDYVEVFGKMERTRAEVDGALLLPRWGADPRHKDVFVEADWCGPPAIDSGANCPTRTTDGDTTIGSPVQRISTGTAADLAAFYSVLPQASIQNPDGADGVAVHIDGPDTNLGTTYGDWGGASCVPRRSSDDSCRGHGDAYGDGHMAENRRGVFHYAILPGGNGDIKGVHFDCGNGGRACAHELGHNLNLGHYGAADGPPLWGIKTRADDTPNCKPAYFSGMNYAYGEGDPTDPARIFYFSRGQLVGSNFVKSALDETVGLGTIALPTFLECWARPGTYCFGTNGFMVDWNRDGVYRSPVSAPVNAARASCGAFSRGSGMVAEDVNSTASVANLGGSYYAFYVKSGRLYYRRDIRSDPYPGNSPVGAGNEYSEQITGPGAWSWSPEQELGVPRGVTQLDAEEFEDWAGTRFVVVTYRDAAGYLRWLTVHPPPSGTGADGFRERGFLSIDPWNFATAEANGLDLEPQDDQLWLMYYRAGTLRMLRLHDNLTWEDEATMVDEFGDPLRPSSIGAALAEGPDGEMLLVDTVLDPANPLAQSALLEARRWEPTADEYDRWVGQGPRFDVAVFTTSDPALAFVARPTTEHALGGWYMLAYRAAPAAGLPLMMNAPFIRLSDQNGRFSASPFDHWTRWQDAWTHLPDDPHNSEWLGSSPYDPGRVLGAFVWAGPRDSPAGVPHDLSLSFMPYADGTSATRVNDQDDAKAIRFGLCYSLRGVSPDCNPPPRIAAWTPTPVVPVRCSDAGSP